MAKNDKVLMVCPVNPLAPKHRYLDKVMEVGPEGSEKLFSAMKRLAELTRTYLVFKNQYSMYDAFTILSSGRSKPEKADMIIAASKGSVYLVEESVSDARANLDRYMVFGTFFARPEVVLDNLVAASRKSKKMTVYAVPVDGVLVPLGIVHNLKYVVSLVRGYML